MQKTIVMTGAVIGTYAGSALPLLWGGSAFSMESVFWSGVGGIAGIYFAYKFARGM
jgi:hypothetical protein